MAGAKFEGFERPTSELGPALHFTLEGKVGGDERWLVVWQWMRGDILMTYSLQAAPRAFEERLGEARAALETLRAIADPVLEGRDPEAGSPPEDDGILEFKVED